MIRRISNEPKIRVTDKEWREFLQLENQELKAKTAKLEGELAGIRQVFKTREFAHRFPDGYGCYYCGNGKSHGHGKDCFVYKVLSSDCGNLILAELKTKTQALEKIASCADNRDCDSDCCHEYGHIVARQALEGK